MQFGNDSVIGWGFGEANPTGTEVFIVGTNPTNGNGAYLSAGGVWTNASTRDKKEDFTALNKTEVLNKIGLLDISQWKYVGTDEYHIGPIAEDFYAAFGVGVNNKSISTIDPAGVALLGVQALKLENDALKNKIDDQQQTISDLLKRIEALENK
jgi:endosialidase-like protein